MYYLYDDKLLNGTSDNRFYLKSIEIYPETDTVLRRVLQPGRFNFVREDSADGESCLLKEFYGHNICVQAIVGVNGSGKSSLLDMFYRLVNNISYFLFSNLKWVNSDFPLAYITGVYARLDYVIDGLDCSLICRGDEMALETPEENFRFGEDLYFPWSYYQLWDGHRIPDLRPVTKYLFYSVVTNYAFNSFVTRDYSLEPTRNLSGQSWIDSIFHKNDGYKTPIVLNPFRNNGSLDINRESDFTVTRSIAILEFYKKKRQQFISGYDLNSVSYNYDPHYFFSHFRKYLTTVDKDELIAKSKASSVVDEASAYECLIKDRFRSNFKRKWSVSRLILHAYGIAPNFDDDIYLVACMYLVYKTLSVIGTYDQFVKYKYLGDIKYCIDILEPKFRQDMTSVQNHVNHVVLMIKKQKTHITLKIHQTVLLLRLFESVNSYEDISHLLINTFELEDYFSICGQDYVKDGTLENLIWAFPPPIFKPTIWLTKVVQSEDTVTNGNIINFSSLSSGEKMFVYTLSTIIYHIQNLISVDPRRVKYKHVNVIMDELELCFHPEMQRQFVYRLISTIENLQLNKSYYFNFLLVTHSPFILSDMLSNNVLYLRQGKDEGERVALKPFSSNVNDLLKNNFFMENGFIGEFAVSKIRKMIDELSDPVNQSCDWRIVEKIINQVGDPIIRESLYDLYVNKFFGQDKARQIAWYERRLKALKK